MNRIHLVHALALYASASTGGVLAALIWRMTFPM